MAYAALVGDVYTNPDYESAPRGLKIKEKLGISFMIENPRDRLLFIPARNFSISYMVAELIWYLSANDKTDWISYYAPFWASISDDGKTANSAYGARIFKPHKYFQRHGDDFTSQWDYVKKELTEDKDSRRAVIHIRMPHDSFLAKKDVPCTLTLQFFIRENKLHLITSMRSSDLILGIAYDVPAFTFMQELLANQLNVKLGTYTHVSNSLHIYERHFEMAEKIIKEPFFDMFLGQEYFQPMHPIPQIQMDDILSYESALREAKSLLHTSIIVEEIIDEQSNLGYWKDWLLILAHYKLIKEKNEDNTSFYIDVRNVVDVQQSIISNIEFEPYKLFLKMS